MGLPGSDLVYYEPTFNYMSNAFNTNQIFTPLEDIKNFHEKFGLEQNNSIVAVCEGPTPDEPTDKWLVENRDKLTEEEWSLRHVRLTDEVEEYITAVGECNDDETLDALVDIIYIALGTAYRRGWDFAEAWKRVHTANMAKERGTKDNSKYGSSFDIVKPAGWKAPTHKDLV